MNDLWAVFLRPFVAFVLLLSAALLARSVERFIPEGRVKRFLYAQHEIVPRDPTSVSPTTRRVCTAILLLIALLIIFKPFRYL